MAMKPPKDQRLTMKRDGCLAAAPLLFDQGREVVPRIDAAGVAIGKSDIDAVFADRIDGADRDRIDILREHAVDPGAYAVGASASEPQPRRRDSRGPTAREGQYQR